MSFDVDKVLGDMLAAVKGNVSKNWDKVKPIVEQMMQNEKENLELMTSLWTNGEITNEQFASRLEDRKVVIEANLEAMKVVSKAMAQGAANAAIDVLDKAIAAAIKTVL